MTRNKLKIISMSILLTLSVGLSSCQRILPPGTDTSTSSIDQDTDNTSSGLETSTSLEDESNSTTDEVIEQTSTTTEAVGTTSEIVQTTDGGQTSTTELEQTSTTTDEDVEQTTTTDEDIEQTTTTDSNLELFPTQSTTTENEELFEKGTKDNPYQIGDTAEFDGYDTLFDPFRAQVVIQQLFRGNEALQMVKDASPLNPDPQDGHEYLIAQVLIKVNASRNDETVGLSNYFFSLANSADGRMYRDVTLLSSVTPALTPIDVGETSIGYVTFEVAIEDENPYIVFLSRANSGIWFETNPDADSTTTELNEGSIK